MAQKYSQKVQQKESYYDHFPTNWYDWREYTAPKPEDWQAFRQEISDFGFASDRSLLFAIGYLVSHLGGKFPPHRQQKYSFWGRIAQQTFDWYKYASPVWGEGFALSHDPAVHFRALRFVVVGFAGLGNGPA